MTSTATTRNRTEQQGTGDNLNTWGARLNASVFALIDEALDGVTSITVSGTVTLSSANFTVDEARRRVLNVTGGTGGAVNIPNVEKVYMVRNAASGAVTIGVTGAVGASRASVPAGSGAIVFCDGVITRVIVDAETILASARAYTDAQAWAVSSGNLPGQTGNAGRALFTNGTTPSWLTIQTTDIGDYASDQTTRQTAASAFAVAMAAAL